MWNIRPRKSVKRFGVLRNTTREMIFRALCRHDQGDKPNILLFCSRRGGSTWILNTVAAHPGMRYSGDAFDHLHRSRWRHLLPRPAQSTSEYERLNQRIFIHFEGKEEEKFLKLARGIIMAEIHLYTSINFLGPYFHRVTNRVIHQLTRVTALIEWFDQHMLGMIVILLRHPIPTSLSIMELKWPTECWIFLRNDWFVDTHMNSKQVDFAKNIMNTGTELEQHVLDWTLKMLIPIRAYKSGKHKDWLVFSYEQAVCTPKIILRELSEKLDLPNISSMETQMQRPSRTVSKKTASRVHDSDYLINRWRKKIDETMESVLMRIPKAFGIDVYQRGTSMPVNCYLLPGEA